MNVDFDFTAPATIQLFNSYYVGSEDMAIAVLHFCNALQIRCEYPHLVNNEYSPVYVYAPFDDADAVRDVVHALLVTKSLISRGVR